MTNKSDDDSNNISCDIPLINPLFDPQIEIECKKYLKKEINNYQLKEKLIKIQFEMDQFELAKRNALLNNSHVFNNLISYLDDIDLIKCIANFFSNKFLLIFKYHYTKNETNRFNFLKELDSYEKEFIILFDFDREPDFFNFDIIYFQFIYKKLNDFINNNVDKLKDNNNLDNNLYYLILENLCNSLYDKDEDNYEDKYFCSITNSILDKPVKMNNTYVNYSAIEKWLNKNETCPYTREKIKIEDIKIDEKMNKEIENLKQNCKYKTKCCNKPINKIEFKQYFFQNCYKKNKNDDGYEFNYDIECYRCRKKYFEHCV